MAIHLEIAGSLLANLLERYGVSTLEGLLRKGGEKIVEAAAEVKHLQNFATLVAKMEEPFRTKMNELYRQAREGKFIPFTQDDFERLLFRAVEKLEDEKDKLEYFYYVSRLGEKPIANPADPSEVLPSIVEELDKLSNNITSQYTEKAVKAARKARKVIKKRVPQAWGGAGRQIGDFRRFLERKGVK